MRASKTEQGSGEERSESVTRNYIQIDKMSAVNQRPRRTPRVASRVKSFDKKETVENKKKVSSSLSSNGFEDISSDSNSSFDGGEFEVGSDWRCGVCGQEVRDSEEGVQCDGCRSWLHTHCGGISHLSYRQMVREEAEGKHCPWLCPGTAGSVISLLVTGWSRQSVTEFLFRLQPHGSVATKNSAWTSQLHRHQWNLQPGRDSSGRQTDEESEQEEPPRGDSSALLGHKGEMTPQCQMFI